MAQILAERRLQINRDSSGNAKPRISQTRRPRGEGCRDVPGRPGTSHLNPTFVPLCAFSLVLEATDLTTFAKPSPGTSQGLLEKFRFWRPLNEPPSHQGTKNRYILPQMNTGKIKNSKSIKPFAFGQLPNAFVPLLFASVPLPDAFEPLLDARVRPRHRRASPPEAGKPSGGGQAFRGVPFTHPSSLVTHPCSAPTLVP
jgi:hypothetical protein